MKIYYFILLVLFFIGCTPAIPREYLARVDRSASYPVVQSNVGRYIGTTIAWGGYIHETRNTPEGTYIEIIESPLDSRDRPEDLDQTTGRFLALFPGYAEAVHYAPGKSITVVGEVRGVKELELGEILYPYPVILRRYDRLWEPRTRPDIHLGVGVGTVFTH
jgi:outer membrane lipoprotein